MAFPCRRPSCLFPCFQNHMPDTADIGIARRIVWRGQLRIQSWDLSWRRVLIGQKFHGKQSIVLLKWGMRNNSAGLASQVQPSSPTGASKWAWLANQGEPRDQKTMAKHSRRKGLRNACSKWPDPMCECQLEIEGQPTKCHDPYRLCCCGWGT